MGLLDEVAASVRPLDEQAMAHVRDRWDRLVLGMGEMGSMRDMVVQYAGALGTEPMELPKRCMVIACADHGAVVHNISAYPVTTTIGMTRNYCVSKGAGANALAAYCNADMVVVDMGVAADMSDVPGLLPRKIAWGTRDYTEGPAMTRAEAIQAIETGIEITEEKIRAGYRVFLVGEMGIANTASAACMIGAFNGWNAVEVTGRGTNISDERLLRKIEVVQKALDVNQPDPTDGLDVLSKVGGFEFGCIVGVILAAAAHQSLVIIDGFNTTACAYVARAIAPESIHYVMASHRSQEQAHKRSLERLGLSEYVDLGFRLGEASGAAIQMKMLDTALLVYGECATGEEIEGAKA